MAGAVDDFDEFVGRMNSDDHHVSLEVYGDVAGVLVGGLVGVLVRPKGGKWGCGWWMA